MGPSLNPSSFPQGSCRTNKVSVPCLSSTITISLIVWLSPQTTGQQSEFRSTASRGQVLSHGGIHVETDGVTYGQDEGSEGEDDWESQKGVSSVTQLAQRTKGNSMV